MCFIFIFNCNSIKYCVRNDNHNTARVVYRKRSYPEYSVVKGPKGILYTDSAYLIHRRRLYNANVNPLLAFLLNTSYTIDIIEWD